MYTFNGICSWTLMGIHDNQESPPSTPRKIVLGGMKETLYRADINSASLIARLREILTTPFAKINPPHLSHLLIQ
jgi:hypothetical protein